MANGEISYTGPKFRDSALVTQDEVKSGEVKAPDGTTPYTVKHGDNLTQIASQNGYGNPPNMEAFYKDNPQYAERNPDLIYPGEVVFVRGAEGSPERTDAAARDLSDTKSQSASTDSQVTGKEAATAEAEADLDAAVRKEIAAGGDPKAIKERLKEQNLPNVSDADIDRIVDAASKPASASNPLGGSREGAPLTPASAANTAAKSYDQARDMHVSTDSQSTGKQERLTKAQDEFKAAITKELAQGTSPDEIKARYGNDADLNKMVDQVLSTGQAARQVSEAQSRSAGTDSQVTAKENAVAGAKTDLEKSVRAELANGSSADAIKARLKADENVKLDDATIDKIVDAAGKPASATNPIGGEATQSAPLSSAYDTNAAAKGVADAHGKSGDTKTADEAFVKAAKQELGEGVSVQELKERYGNDATLNKLIDQAAAK
ncbi:LysM peptidoglycan-binding domain-containing protein [Luteimonas aquatica]|uniref:LysM peptidoglycan-binding domain-containing protein n=1 Tax=Luteimonas aquatica TaxID=450364 RepID=UPI001F5799E2|nr:LysM domain-containing protein [Luteimonas aquatica]